MDKQIGWFYLKEDTEFTNTYECAAWYENVMVKAGRYPMEVSDFQLRNRNEGKEVYGYIDMVRVKLPGIVTSDDFGARYFGIPVGNYDNYKNTGKESSYSFNQYLYAVADVILHPNTSIYKNPKWEFELLPEYVAKDIRFIYDGEENMIHGIFLKEVNE